MCKLIPLFAVLLLVSCNGKDKPEVKVNGGKDKPPEAEGVMYAPNDAKCEIWFPKAPEERSPAEGRKLFTLATEKKGHYFLLVRTNAKAVDIANQEAVDKVFAKSKEALVELAEGIVKKKKKKAEDVQVTFKERFMFADKYPAINFEITTGKGGEPGFIVLTPTRTYGIVVAGPKEFIDSPEVKKFRESFKVKE
jgi:hypothetical protein